MLNPKKNVVCLLWLYIINRLGLAGTGLHHLFYRHDLSYHDFLSTACNIFGSKRCLGGNIQEHPQTVQTVHFHEERTLFCTVCTQWRGNTLAQIKCPWTVQFLCSVSANKQMHCCEKFKWNRECGRQNSTNMEISFLTKLKMLRI